MTKLIIVDDSKTARQKIKNDFAGRDFEIIEARDGLEGIAKIEADPDIKFVICDVNMPNMNGLAMCEKLAESGVRLTIIMLTTESSVEMIDRGRKAGVKAWVTKPYNPEKLIQTVEKMNESRKKDG